VGDDTAIGEGCEWVRQFGQVNPERMRVYACIESLRGLENVSDFEAALQSLYGTDTLSMARALLEAEVCFFGQPALGLDLGACDMHQRLLAAYGKLHSSATA
jgi:ribosomal protein S12 methylthiotransferase accessory factor